jgi:O-acetyl-ADP-ribose deacetylase (regulator of RNase III)
MIRYTNGNLLKDDADVLVNTVNLAGKMGKGIALAFKQAFPNNYSRYVKACAERSLTIGRLLVVQDNSIVYGKKTIINLPTKTHWSKPSEYAYIGLGLIALREHLLQIRPHSIALPQLGCGNGGLDWQQVKPMMEKALAGLDVLITIYEP